MIPRRRSKYHEMVCMWWGVSVNRRRSQGRANRWLLIGVLALSGCAAHWEVVSLHVQTIPPPRAPKKDLVVLISPFEDRRPDRCRLGIHTHRWGGQSFFRATGGKAGYLVQEAMANYLRAKEGWTVALEKPQGFLTSVPTTPDITLSGRVLDLVVDVENKLFHTAIQAKSRIAV